MQSYIIRRILLLIPTVFIVAVIVFFLVRFVPGSAVDVIEAQLSQGGSINIDRNAIAHALGLDVPAYIQFWKWLGAIVLHGDFGNSIIQSRPVIQMIGERLPITLELGLLALIIEVVIALPLGIYAAVRQDTPSDYAGRTAAVLLMAIPNFWIGTLVMIYPSTWWGWSPSVELIPFARDPLGNLGMFLLPAAILAASGAGGLMRMTRTMMLEVMRQDYVRTAWAKGLNEGTVIVRHGVKNAFIPVITIIGAGVGNLMGGAVIMENIFCLPGMGQLVLTALNNRDYPVVSCVVLVISVFVMTVNLVVDMAYTWLDPRIRYQ